MIAAVVLFLGTGPVQGFAVTLSLGILTSVFTADTVTLYVSSPVVPRPPAEEAADLMQASRWFRFRLSRRHQDPFMKICASADHPFSVMPCRS